MSREVLQQGVLTAMRSEDLVSFYPNLYHMAHAGSWPAIRERGLLTTRQLVDLYEMKEPLRGELLRRRRAHSTTITHPILGSAVIRDQAPLREQFLAGSLSDMTVEEWLDALNGRVFFWLHKSKLDQLLSTRLYRSRDHDVLTVDTARLLARHADQVRLSPINSGATLYPNAPTRGQETFRTILDYPYEARRRRGPTTAIVELAVIDGIRDIGELVTRVERRRRSEVVAVLHPTG